MCAPLRMRIDRNAIRLHLRPAAPTPTGQKKCHDHCERCPLHHNLLMKSLTAPPVFGRSFGSPVKCCRHGYCRFARALAARTGVARCGRSVSRGRLRARHSPERRRHADAGTATRRRRDRGRSASPASSASPRAVPQRRLGRYLVAPAGDSDASASICIANGDTPRRRFARCRRSRRC